MPHYGVPASIALGRCRRIAQLQRQTVQPTALITLEDTESDSLHPLSLSENSPVIPLSRIKDIRVFLPSSMYYLRPTFSPNPQSSSSPDGAFHL